VIDIAEVAALAVLYDRYPNGLERLSPERLMARRQFYARLEMLYERERAGVNYEAFCFERSGAAKNT